VLFLGKEGNGLRMKRKGGMVESRMLQKVTYLRCSTYIHMGIDYILFLTKARCVVILMYKVNIK
jgi:hypothetical protein